MARRTLIAREHTVGACKQLVVGGAESDAAPLASGICLALNRQPRNCDASVVGLKWLIIPTYKIHRAKI